MIGIIFTVIIWVAIIWMHVRIFVVNKVAYRILEEADLMTLDMMEEDPMQDSRYVYDAVAWHTYSKKVRDWKHWNWYLDKIIEEYNKEVIMKEVETICK